MTFDPKRDLAPLRGLGGRRRALSPGTEAVVAAGLFAYFLACALVHARTATATYDEPTHLASGYSYWKLGDHRLNPEHPPLVKRLAALPLLVADPWPVGEGTARSRGELERLWGLGARNVDAQWAFAHELFYGVTDGALDRFAVARSTDLPNDGLLRADEKLQDADRLFLLGRLPIVGLGALLLLVVWRWARRLWGPDGGLLALALAAADPNLIAHSSLVTTDVGLALAWAAATWALWMFGRRPAALPAVAFVGAVAAAFATKHSAPLLVPVWLLLAVWPRRERERGARVSRRLVLVGLGLLAAWAGLWMAYGWSRAAVAGSEESPIDLAETVRRTAAARLAFDLAPQGPTASDMDDAQRRAVLGVADRALLGVARSGLLPEAYLTGLADARLDSQARWSYLRGEVSLRGFRSYFAWAFLLKTPLVALAALTAALAALAFGRAVPERGSLVFLVLPASVLFAAASLSHLNIGHRHLLPVYPFLWVLGGAAAAFLVRRSGTWTRLAPVALVLVACSWVLSPVGRPQAVHPHYLAYFNELAGGPRGGSRSLVDSNLDWGQDLRRLADYLTAQRVEEPIGLCYFGMADPRWYGIRHVKLPGGYPLSRPLGGRASFAELERPALVAISVTHWRGPYLGPELRAAWTAFLADAELEAVVGRSIRVYRLPG